MLHSKLALNFATEIDVIIDKRNRLDGFNNREKRERENKSRRERESRVDSLSSFDEIHWRFGSTTDATRTRIESYSSNKGLNLRSD